MGMALGIVLLVLYTGLLLMAIAGANRRQRDRLRGRSIGGGNNGSGSSGADGGDGGGSSCGGGASCGGGGGGGCGGGS